MQSNTVDARTRGQPGGSSFRSMVTYSHSVIRSTLNKCRQGLDGVSALLHDATIGDPPVATSLASAEDAARFSSYAPPGNRVGSGHSSRARGRAGRLHGRLRDRAPQAGDVVEGNAATSSHPSLPARFRASMTAVPRRRISKLGRQAGRCLRAGRPAERAVRRDIRGPSGMVAC
jgi:hypothetical protein